MEQELKDEWTKVMSSLLNLDTDRRKHFALLLINLAKCYDMDSGWQAVVLIDNKDALLTFSAGADEYDAARMLQLANAAVISAATMDAPAKEMMN